MKSIKELMGKVAETTAYTIMAASFLLAMEAPLFRAYTPGFVKNYNQAIARNADVDGNGQITPTEELIFKQSLIREITELKEQGRNRDEIVDWLKTR